MFSGSNYVAEKMEGQIAIRLTSTFYTNYGGEGRGKFQIMESMEDVTTVRAGE